MNIILNHMSCQNFKGIDSMEISFADRTTISGRNASGKTTIMDAFFWLLFDKDSSGSNNFQIRPKDAYGKDIDNVEIAVTCVFDVDGSRLELKKTQKQKWVKKRGSDAPTYEGNENLFEINGFPSSKREYTAKIASLIDEDIFSLLSNPRAFASLPWKAQREIILRLVTESTDEDLLSSVDEDYSLIEQDVLEAGADKAREKYQKALRRLKDEQKSYPIRIDEASKSLVETVPFEELTVRKQTVQEELDQIKRERNNVTDAMQSVKEVQKQIFDLRYKLSVMEEKANEALNARKMAINAKRQKAHAAINDVEMQFRKGKQVIDSTRLENEADEKRIKELAERFKAVKRSVLPDGETVCPTCGRPFDEDKIEHIRGDFEKFKAAELERIGKEGKALRQRINAAVAAIEEAEKRQDKSQEAFAQMTEKLKALDEQYASLPDKEDISGTDEYKTIEAQIEKLDEKLSLMDNEDERQLALDAREQQARDRMKDITAQFLAHDQNAKAQERILHLQNEQRECSQMVADEERKLYLVENFIKAKMNILSDEINAHFKTVKFKLFETQINGAVNPTCVMQINSNGSYVDYANANNAAQIIGGLDVIDALSELYATKVPVWIDNSEAIDTANTPNVNTQIILLKVTDEDLAVTEG